MKILIPLLQLISLFANAQPGLELLSFKRHADKSAKKDDSSADRNHTIKYELTADYLTPLANAFSSKELLINHSKDRYYDHLTQYTMG